MPSDARSSASPCRSAAPRAERASSRCPVSLQFGSMPVLLIRPSGPAVASCWMRRTPARERLNHSRAPSAPNLLMMELVDAPNPTCTMPPLRLLAPSRSSPFSRRRTRAPRSAARRAAERPEKPPPATTQSTLVGSGSVGGVAALLGFGASSCQATACRGRCAGSTFCMSQE